MNRIAALLGILLGSLVFVQATLAQEKKDSLPKGYQAVGPDKESALRKLCQATAESGRFSGAVLVADKGEVIYKEAFGFANRESDIPNTTDTKFRLASVSKQFCTMIVMQLVQEGKIKLDDKITDFLPYYRKDTGDKITLHHSSIGHQRFYSQFRLQRYHFSLVVRQGRIHSRALQRRFSE